MSWIKGEFVIDSISQQSLAKARAQIVDRVRHNADLEEFSNMGEDIGNITPIYPPESCCKSFQSAEEWYEKSYAAFRQQDAAVSGSRRHIFSSLPLYTMSDELLCRLLKRHGIEKENSERIMVLQATQNRNRYHRSSVRSRSADSRVADKQRHQSNMELFNRKASGSEKCDSAIRKSRTVARTSSSKGQGK